jgi:hypothetical protein
MWHHVTNHLIISNDKDSNSEMNEKYASVTFWSAQSVVRFTAAPSLVNHPTCEMKQYISGDYNGKHDDIRTLP